MGQIVSRNSWLDSLAVSGGALDLIVKATVLLMLALCVLLLQRRSSAAMRHRVCSLTFSGLLLLPLLSWALPEWRIPLLPAVQSYGPVESADRVGASEQGAASENAASATTGLPTHSNVWQRMDSVREWPGQNIRADGDPVNPSSPLHESFAMQQAELAAPAAKPVSISLIPSWRVLAAVVWITGFLAALLPLAIGMLQNLRVCSASRPVTEAEWTALQSNLCRSLNLVRQVRLLETGEPLIPMTCGLLHPIVLLPQESRTWSERLRRFVLLHELAHVKRFDVGFQILARFVCSLYWFHPLAWYVLRRLRSERELACDDCILAAGERPSEYAAQLLEIARAFRPLRTEAAVAMAQGSQLEHRVRALLDRARSHQTLSGGAARRLLCGAALVVTAIAVARPGTRAAPPENRVDSIAVAQAASKDPGTAQEAVAQTNVTPESAISVAQTEGKQTKAKETAVPPAAERRVNVTTISGRVLDPAGQPLAGAELYWSAPGSASQHELVLERKGATEDDGRIHISLPDDAFSRERRDLSLIAWKLGYAPAWIAVEKGKSQEDVTWRLVEDLPVRGRILTTEGLPVVGARIRVSALMQPKSGRLDAFLVAAQREWNITPKQTARVLNEPVEELLFATTGPDGRFELNGIGAERAAKLNVEGPGIANSELVVVTREGFDASSHFESTGSARVVLPARPVFVGPEFDHVAEAEATIAGSVYLGKDREPVAGANVWAGAIDSGGAISRPIVTTHTDANGLFKVHGLGGTGEVLLNVEPPSGTNLLTRTVRIGPIEGGESTYRAEVELHRGIVVTGQVVDRATGRGAAAGIRAVLLPENTFIQKRGYESHGGLGSTSSDAEGHFRMVVIPGPLVLKAQTYPERMDGRYVNLYRRGKFGEEDLRQMSPAGRTFAADKATDPLQNGLKYLDVPAEAAEVNCTIPVDSGRTAEVRIVDDDGRPVESAYIGGMADTWPTAFKLLDSTCTVYALDPAEPRSVLFLHPERKLAGIVVLRGDEPEPVTVTLAAAGSLTGRAVEEGGVPLANAHVEIGSSDEQASELYRFSRLEQEIVRTDEDGRFGIENVLPAMPFFIDFSSGRAAYRAGLTPEQRQVQSGAELDLGTVNLRKLR